MPLLSSHLLAIKQNHDVDAAPTPKSIGAEKQLSKTQPDRDCIGNWPALHLFPFATS